MEEESERIKNIRKYYEEKLQNKPSTTQIISFGISCFALGVSLAKFFI